MKEQLHAYREYLNRLPMSHHTRRAYFGRVRSFLTWLQESVDGAEALNDAVARDLATRDYKTYLLQAGRSACSVNAALAALDNFYLYIGLGAAPVRRQNLPVQAPRALQPDEQRRLMKAIARAKSLRNCVVALTMLHCGLRISEVHQLNVGDVLLSARKHELVVRCGKNAKRRTVPVNSELAAIMREYLASVGHGALPESPLFISQKGNRLSVQAIDQIIRRFGREAGIDFSSHCLRHTCITRLVRSGVDLVVIAEVVGHSRLETTRRYALPTEAVKEEAMERLAYAATQA